MAWKFIHWNCDRCNKVNHVHYDDGGLVFTPTENDEKEKSDEIERLKNSNNWCDGNCNKRERERAKFRPKEFSTRNYLF
ncbi:MAG: hypothetical protein mread185_000454 [Mycoplasmataceae bacterium]|nr:MAG: hypothetical protein mread185_000454 [Mycoplasmataceae bacterium]